MILIIIKIITTFIMAMHDDDRDEDDKEVENELKFIKS